MQLNIKEGFKKYIMQNTSGGNGNDNQIELFWGGGLLGKNEKGERKKGEYCIVWVILRSKYTIYTLEELA